MPAQNTKNKTNPSNKLRVKYIFVSGGVISGIGKGTSAASIGLLLQSAGYRVSPIKFEGYLNIDSGTINPIEHGDVFLCEDGTEADMDIGTYEKFLNLDMCRDNFVTMGQIYKTIIDRERRFEYRGEDVEAIHICDEIIQRINNVAHKNNADIAIVELGGTVGEYWNVFYYEAARMMALKNPDDVIHIHVSYLPTPKHLGEPKTKPTQLSVRLLNSIGIQPNFIIARSEKYIDQRRRDRFALYCNMHADDIISSPDLESVYEIPFIFHQQNLDGKILSKLNLPPANPSLNQWKSIIDKIKKKKEKTATIAIIGKYFGTGDYQLRDSYAALFDAIDHASWEAGVKVITKWIDAEKIESTAQAAFADKTNKEEAINKIIGDPDGIIVPIGWGERGAEGMIQAASYARVNKIPYLGLCYGMQLAVVAFARDILEWRDANTIENNKNTKHPVIHLIPKQNKFMERRAYGGTMRLGAWKAKVKEGSLAYKIYEKHNSFEDKNNTISERHRHRYEFNKKYEADFEKNGLLISAKSKLENLVEIIEMDPKIHPFYFGIQGHPEYKSRPQKPHPIFVEFLTQCAKSKIS